MNKFEMHLAAKLFRISNPISDFKPDFEKIKFLSNVLRADKRLVSFSGCFCVGRFRTLLPFALGFSFRDGVSFSGVGSSFAFTDSRIQPRIIAFLSLIDYLVEVGELPVGALEHHVKHIGEIKNAIKSDERKLTCDGYADFCIRAAKDLPYDMSLEVLGEVA